MNIKKLVLLLSLIGVLIFGALGQIGYLKKSNFLASVFVLEKQSSEFPIDVTEKPVVSTNNSTNKMKDEICSPVVDGLKFCTSKPVISAKLGEKIVFQGTLKNVSNQKVSVSNSAGFDSLYKVSVIGPQGSPLKSKRAIAAEKVVSGTATSKEATDALPFGSIRTNLNKVLEPGEELSLTYDLETFYDFGEKGIYQLSISRIIGQALSDKPRSNLHENSANQLKIDHIKIQVS